MKSQARKIAAFDALPVITIPTIQVEKFYVSGTCHFASLDGGAASREAHWYAADLRGAWASANPQPTVAVVPQGRNDWAEFVFAVTVTEGA